MSTKATPRQQEAADALSAVMAQFPDVFGPVQCKVHGWDEEVCDCNPEENGVAVPAFLSEYVLVSNWVEAETGDSMLCDFANPGSLLTHSLGLLRAQTILLERDL